uniref:Uncharacterized protein n=1 Tax=Corvus moneduloides TaxID=1196302 RepID=A0A8C3DDG9_CORMO
AGLWRALAADGPGLVGELRDVLCTPGKLRTWHRSVSKGKPRIFPQLKSRTKHPRPFLLACHCLWSHKSQPRRSLSS